IYRHAVRRDGVEGLADEVRMPANQADQAFQVLGTLERRAVALVEPADLVPIEIAEAKRMPDVEGRLVEILDEQRGLGGVGDEQIESVPNGMSGAAVVPAAQH